MAMADVCGGAPGSASFLAMWMAMMVPMMLPSLAPALWRCGLAVAGGGRVRWTALTLAAGLGYFFVWALIGLAVDPLHMLFGQQMRVEDIGAGNGSVVHVRAA